MKFTANQIAEILEGTVVGDANIEVDKLSKIEEGQKGSLTFLSNPKYTHFIYSTNASIAIVNNEFIPEKEIKTTLIKVEDAYKAFSKLLTYYNEIRLNKSGIENPHFISESATLGEDVYIAAFSYISDNVKIGNNVKIYPNAFIGDNVQIGENTIIMTGVKIYSDCIVGDNCVLHAGIVIGADGFGFAPNEEGIYSKVPQIGNVIIEDNVDIGACTTIDRATLGSTIIRKGVKLDNQIQIAHNVEIGENTVVAAQTGIAGSTKIGSNCMLGGQVGIVGHITIGNNVKIQAQSGISKNVKDNEVIQGSPAFGYGDFYKSYVYFKKLPELVATINSLEKEIKKLKD
ncbi:UDP-3-O-(3-hydroxymyristoyl)glucosamine N-acyltransferase [Lutibacter sp.]|uniref:UDP-3-O-(3-hydroxymyristoyl)glucosamine N-acyltransferase n=1 Tax=Lutibacter sp. TaxID=1925666 RepID=UPI0025C374A5|nr:UDP-3-O-(3-hydroxymyristoyl)glucosamine N-acyltransferase [Lutibacter sp.]MCF6181346.1 UDP-3-O-(3-hydroxymyristoyl)glucosamine N-acyltransferase [Lutibacter sp.]